MLLLVLVLLLVLLLVLVLVLCCQPKYIRLTLSFFFAPSVRCSLQIVKGIRAVGPVHRKKGSCPFLLYLRIVIIRVVMKMPTLCVLYI